MIVKGRIKTVAQGFEHTYQLVSTAWLIAYFLCRFLRPFSEIVFGGFMQYTLYPIGIAILLYQLFFSIKINLTDRILHLAIPGWFLVAGIMRNGGISFDLLVSTCIIALVWCAMYWYGCNQEGKKLFAAMKVFFHTICGIISVFCLIALIDIICPFLPDTPPYNAIGIYTFGRFWLLDNPNTTGMLFFVCILGCLYLLWNSRGWHRFLLIGEILLLFVCFILTDSRTCFVQISLAVGALAFRTVYSRSQKQGTRWFFGVAACLICTALFYVLLVQAGKGLAWIQKNSADQQDDVLMMQEQNVAVDTQKQEIAKDAVSEEMINIRPVDSVYTVGTRLDLWRAWLDLLAEEPTAWLHGTNKTPVFEKGKEEAGAHNVYIALLVCHGLPALFLLLCLTIRSIKPALVLFLKGEEGIHVLPVLCSMFLVNGLMETQIFYSVSLVNMLFAVVAGFLMGVYRNHWIEGSNR